MAIIYQTSVEAVADSDVKNHPMSSPHEIHETCGSELFQRMNEQVLTWRLETTVI